MFCENCGTQLPDNATACNVCGAMINNAAAEPAAYEPAEAAYIPSEPMAYTPAEPTYYTPAPEYTADAATLSSLATNSLVMGILGLCLCFVPILGIIFSKKGMKKASEYNSMATAPSGKAKTGKILGTIGLVFSIIYTICFIIGIIIGILGVIAGVAYL